MIKIFSVWVLCISQCGDVFEYEGDVASKDARSARRAFINHSREINKLDIKRSAVTHIDDVVLGELA